MQGQEIKWHGAQIQQRIRCGERCLGLLVSCHRICLNQTIPETHPC